MIFDLTDEVESIQKLNKMLTETVEHIDTQENGVKGVLPHQT